MAVLYRDLEGNLKELTLKQADTLPIGVIAEYASDKIPDNWLLCDGREIDRKAYKSLFNTIGTKYGSGDGTNTFNLPDLRGKVVVGKSSETEFNDLGKTGGEKTHTLTTNEMPSHNHRVAGRVNTSGSPSVPDGAIPAVNANTGDGWWAGYTEDSGKNQAHNNLQPYIVVNYIIKCGISAGIDAVVIDELNSDSSTDALSAYQGKVLNDKINELNNNSIKEKGMVGLNEFSNFTFGSATYRYYHVNFEKQYKNVPLILINLVDTTGKGYWGSLNTMLYIKQANNTGFEFVFSSSDNQFKTNELKASYTVISMD